MKSGKEDSAKESGCVSRLLIKLSSKCMGEQNDGGEEGYAQPKPR